MQIDVPIRKGAIAGEVTAAPMAAMARAAHTYWSMARALGSPPTNRVVAFAHDGELREEGRGMAKSKAIPWTVRPIRVMDGCYSHALMHSLSFHSLSTYTCHPLGILKASSAFLCGNDTHVGRLIRSPCCV